MSLLEDLDAVDADLVLLDEQLRWAHTNAYWPGGRGLDATPGTSLAIPAGVYTGRCDCLPHHPEPVRDEVTGNKPPWCDCIGSHPHLTTCPANPDQVGGPTYDLELGDENTRTALHTAIEKLRDVEARLTLGVFTAAVLGEEWQRQPTLTRPRPNTPPGDLLDCVTNCQWRSTRVRLLVGTMRRDVLHDVGAQIGRARRSINVAVLDLGKVLGQTGTPNTRTAAAMCRICGIRAALAKKGGRCSTCDQYKTRHHHERPTSLDTDGEEGQAAADRRVARHETAALAPLPVGTPMAIVEGRDWHAQQEANTATPQGAV